MKTFAFVFARGNSKGVPGKNIRQLVDKPLLGHALAVASQIPEIERSFVSTDSSEIAAVAEAFGATVISRPAELAEDTSPEWLAWRHAIEWVRETVGGDFDRFISLPTTAPLRLAEDVSQCMAALDDETDVVVTMTAAHRSPWFNMVKANDDGHLSILVDGGGRITRRQDAPQAFDLTTLAYVMRPNFIMTHDNLWQGRVKGVLFPQERAIDIDTEFDFRVAEFLMQERVMAEKKHAEQ
ncbi:acylneuraminate cytidylyltransferase [Thiorhodococcus drewsii AZ1]|uniref:Acylneuraminate cytidylyltransferase n=1 Tax=Thiorhodococcus drewsii AZ1 TaxID=765913 RepID=G2E7E4_9GAMM|nr:acylneuraminate cytidylyltransferase family protein [Thiorhodococcus drewsii]EGV27983.1 acylneuraminate cytidylyltransferase [Thiorhodococcus drewsii AZ1]